MMHSHSRKEEIQELVFSSQLTNNRVVCCWDPWVSLSWCYSWVQLPRTVFIEAGRSEHATKRVGHFSVA